LRKIITASKKEKKKGGFPGTNELYLFLSKIHFLTSCRVKIAKHSKPGLSMLAFGSPKAPF
jgi:hypothetical protein